MRSYFTTLGSLAAVGVLIAAVPSCSSDAKGPSSSSGGAVDPDLSAAKATLAKTPLGQVVSRDPRGAGRFVVSPQNANAARLNLGHETAARLHFERHAKALGIDDSTARGAIFKSWQSLPAGGGIAQFEQRIDNIEVFRARASVVVDGSNQLVTIGNSFPATAKSWTNAKSFKSSAESAIASAYTAHAGLPLQAQSIRDEGEIAGSSMRNYAVDAPAGGLQVVSATAKKVFFPTGDRLEAAYYVEILGRVTRTRAYDARGFVIAADDGRVLQQESLTHEDKFKYRVWASMTGNNIPDDGPNTDATPHPTGLPDNKAQTYTMPNLIEIEGFNKGGGTGPADPWLPMDATTTWGNNVRAYSDRNQGTTEAGAATNDGFQDSGAADGAYAADLIADVTGPKTFDRVYDIAKAPNDSANQVKAAITQLFYVNNWLHDYWYDSGFDEKAGNAQTDNLGRGGVAGDPIRAEAQDSADNGQSNNANMNTLADGSPPRMQMYVWSGLPKRTLAIPGVMISDPLGASGFGPQIFDVPATNIVLANDGDTTIPPGGTGTMGTTSDGCQAIPNIMGKIAIIDRGQCGFVNKVQFAQMGGAVGVILVNNVGGNAAPSPGGVLNTTVPLIGVSKEDGDRIKAAVAANAALTTTTFKREAEILRDGTIDNTIVAHEWGHFWHHRLVSCGSTSCGGMSEGWGDLQAVMLAIKDGDTFDGGKTYAMSQYAAAGISKDGLYYGIRRAPYSKDKTKNPFTFGHIRAMATLPTTAPLAPAGAEMNEVHNVGEIWTETLFEAYTNLIDKLKAANPPVSFEEIKRRFADYLVAGMKATPGEPTFVEQRDAILGAVLATKRMDDFSAIAQGFATRGLGVGAKAPPTTSTTLNEAEENFDFKGASGFVEATIDDSGSSCDKDGNLDVNETGKLTVKIKNTGWVKLTKTLVTASSSEPNLTFTAPTTMLELEPYQEKTVTIDVAAKTGVMQKGIVPIVVSIKDADAVAPTLDTTVNALINFDEAKASSKTDDVESTLPPVWTMAHADPMSMTEVWSREGNAKDGHVWHGDALAAASDESLISPTLTVSATENFTIAFKHHYTFESGTNPLGGGTAYFDGGVLEIQEISGEAGGPWTDVSTYVDPTYPVTIFSGMSGGIPDTNVLAGKKAWGGRSAGYPAHVPVSLDLGNKLAGKTIRVRFRIGTDEGTAAAGWDIDDIAFGGITNSPFSKIADNSGVCAGDGGTTDGGRADGSAGAGGSTGGSGGSGGAGGSGGGTADDGCSCSVPGGQSTSRGAAALSALGALAAMFIRRRRRQQ